MYNCTDNNMIIATFDCYVDAVRFCLAHERKHNQIANVNESNAHIYGAQLKYMEII